MKNFPKNYTSFLSLEETLLVKNKLHNFLLSELEVFLNVIKIESPTFAFNPNSYGSKNFVEHRPVNFDVSSSNDVLEIFSNFDK